MKKALTFLAAMGTIYLSSPALAHNSDVACLVDSKKITETILRMERTRSESEEIGIPHHFTDNYMKCLTKNKNTQLEEFEKTGQVYNIHQVRSAEDKYSLKIEKITGHF